MSTRLAQPHDAEFVAQAFMAGFTENEWFGTLPRHTSTARQHATLLLTSPSAFCIIAEQDAKPVGLVIAQQSIYIGTTVPFIADVVLYVAPEHRGGGLAQELMAALEAEARARGLHSIVFPEGGSNQPQAIARLAAAFGYTADGTIYRRKL